MTADTDRDIERQAFDRELVGVQAALIAFCVSLTGNRDTGADLMQETLLRTLINRDKFQLGTSMKAWVFVIARNEFYSRYRRERTRLSHAVHARRSMQDVLQCVPEPEAALNLRQLWREIDKLPPEQRRALLAVGRDGMTYDEAAAEAGCKLGTIKSRVCRSRGKLRKSLVMAHI